MSLFTYTLFLSYSDKRRSAVSGCPCLDFFYSHLRVNLSPFLSPTLLPQISSFPCQLSTPAYPFIHPNSLKMCPTQLAVILGSILSHRNVPQMPELYSVILNLARSGDPFTTAVGNIAYFLSILLPVQLGPNRGHAVKCPTLTHKSGSCVWHLGVLPPHPSWSRFKIKQPNT